MLEDKKDYTIVLAIYNDTDNNYFIQHYDRGNKTEYIYDKVEDFLRDKKINSKDKHTFIKVFRVCKP